MHDQHCIRGFLQALQRSQTNLNSCTVAHLVAFFCNESVSDEKASLAAKNVTDRFFNRIYGVSQDMWGIVFLCGRFQVLDLRHDNSGLPDEIRPELT